MEKQINRVLIGQNPRVAKPTLAQLKKWKAKKGPSVGVIIDRLTTHAVSTNFNPANPETNHA